MQTVRHDYQNIHPIFDDIERFYILTSNKILKQSLIPPSFDTVFKPLQQLFDIYGQIYYDIDFVVKNYAKLAVNANKCNMVVCFSGGKDSLTTALHYQKMGYNVYLYHLRGINKIYTDEWKQSQILADKIGLPLIIDTISLPGQHDWVEHPMKNMILANMCLQWSIRNDMGIKIAFGNFRTSHIWDDVFEVCGGDTMEMWDAYESIIRKVIPEFKLYHPNVNYQTAFNKLLNHQDLIPYTISCLTPNRFRGKLRKLNISKYDIPLPETRCGSCWKCAVEYIWFCDHDVFPYNKQYYEHCLQILQQTVVKERKIKLSLENAFYEYFFYPITKSYYFKEEYRGTI